jgi:DNA-binding NarL/FixJ family response regulator
MISDTFTVAIVDDHPLFREVTHEYLIHEGFKVLFEAPNGMALLQRLERCQDLPDVCLLDVEMPVLNGYETARCLRAQYPEVKILAFTLFPDEGRKAKLLEAGADNVMAKESGPALLKKALIKTYTAIR